MSVLLLEELGKKELIEEILRLRKEKEQLEQDKETLEKELLKYKNPHTPSSQKRLDKHPQKAFALKKAGAPIGHRGATRQVPAIDETVQVPVCECPRCQSKNIARTGNVEERVVEGLTLPRRKITKYEFEEGNCNDCGYVFLSQHPEVPDEGIFDKSVNALVSYLKIEGRMSYALIGRAMQTLFDFPMTAPTALEITHRVAKQTRVKYEELKNIIQEEKSVNADETSVSVNGHLRWTWGFFTKLVSLINIAHTRGPDVIEESLGSEFEGIINCDGWHAYKTYSKKHRRVLLQRCWEHAKREVDFVCDGIEELEPLCAWFHDIKHKVEDSHQLKSDWGRERRFQQCKKELCQWLDVISAYRKLRKIATTMKNGGDDWFTCILYPEIEPTNNAGERDLRPFVLLRKIFGCLRNHKGVLITETLLSLFSSWKKQGLNPFDTLRAIL